MTEIIWLQRMYSVSMATCNYACSLESRYSLTESMSIPPLLREAAVVVAAVDMMNVLISHVERRFRGRRRRRRRQI